MEGNTPVMVELDAGDLGGPRLRRGRLGVAFHRYRQSAEESTPAQNAKTPPGTQPDGGVMVSVIVVVSQRNWDVLTPRPPPVRRSAGCCCLFGNDLCHRAMLGEYPGL